MECFGTFAAGCLLVAGLSARSLDKKLLSGAGELNAADLLALAAFDPLDTWCDISGASVDTTPALTDPFWMSVLGRHHRQ